MITTTRRTGNDGEVEPFYVAGAPTRAPRLLLISYHFPPGQAVGALRWQKLAGYAAERGWELDAVTADPASLARTDPSRLEELPEGTRVYGVPQPELAVMRVERAAWQLYRRVVPKQDSRSPGAAHAAATKSVPSERTARHPSSLGRDEIRQIPRTLREFYRAYTGLLDFARDAAWARRAARVALKVARSGAHSAVITCGPPHMAAHEAGRLVSLDTELPLVVDMRDPWSLVQRLPEHVASPTWLGLARRAERRVVAQAALVVSNTEPACAGMRSAYPEARDRVITITNGYDDEAMPPARLSDRFTIAYAGTIYLDRDPRLLFRAAARVIRELGLAPSRFGIDFIGNVESYDGIRVEELARQEGVGDFVTVGPARPRHEAMQFLAGAPMLVSLPQDSDMAIPSKIFEYMRFNAWLLALAERDSATDLLLRGSGADVVAPSDVDGMAAVLRTRFTDYARGVRPVPIANDHRFSRRYQAQLLLDAIAACTESPQPARRLLARARAR